MKGTVVETPRVDPVTGDDREKDHSGPHIRCPLCHWPPAEHDRWLCACGHSWNTFDTGGVCPACLFQWTTTQCLKCGRWSAHSDWYEE